MPRTNTKPLGTNVTPNEYDFVRDTLATESGGIAPYLRQLIQRDARRRGLDWPGETVPRGKAKWQQCPQCAGWNVGASDGTRACADCGWVSDD